MTKMLRESYGFIIDGGLICPDCFDENDEGEEVFPVGYPDGYTCASCGEVTV